MRAGGKGKGRMREDWYRPRVQGHECEGYRTSLPPGRANLSDTVRRHSLFHAQQEDGGRGEEEEEQRERGNVKEEEKRTNGREKRGREKVFFNMSSLSKRKYRFSEASGFSRRNPVSLVQKNLMKKISRRFLFKIVSIKLASYFF